ncbi:hypothetical protein CR194_08630 [Salipaludibacillus keqinensis]|uniref:2-dehydropantoate 2-reductase n=1 Tax=Salipaludibacillus keqinensis TaxID=2045207 RepID=A0A323TDR7_9BACI|nr:2-dehydropantoate 2-reductase [Salipaludibacillus keqinensis]PYZ93251.1 hypothetical protein CR194_08630 [Salipaludibacillus keqinensis]
MKITVIGAGAIGLLTSGYLQKAGHEIQLVTRTKEQAEQILLKGLSYKREEETLACRVAASPIHLSDMNWADLIMVTVKQPQLPSVMNDLKGKVPPDTPMLFLQNGMGHMETIEQTFHNPLFVGVVTHGAMKTSPVEVKHTGIGKIIVGGKKEWQPLLLELLTGDDPFSIEWSDDTTRMMEKKLLVNLVINPLTFIYQVKNGELLKDSRLKREVYAIFKEGASVLGFEENAWEDVMGIIQQTRENQSSMLSDRKAESITEADAITGYILNRAKKSGKTCPKIQELHDEVKHIEGENENA